MSSHRWNRLSIFCILVLLFMILSRLIWIQARSGLIHWQMNLLLLTIIAASWLARFLSGSWVISLIVATTLLSRGAMLTRLGTTSSDVPITLLLTIWAACSAHFFRSGSKLSFLAAAGSVVIASFYEQGCAVLLLALPIFLSGAYPLFLGRFRRWFLESNSVPASASLSRSLVRPLETPFLFWICAKQRWLKFSSVHLLLFLIFGLLVPYFHTSLIPWPLAWTSLFIPSETPAIHLDTHYFACFMVSSLCAINSPISGLRGLTEVLWVLGIASLILVSVIDPSLSSGKLLVWIEPIMLTLGIVCFFHLLKVAKGRIAH